MKRRDENFDLALTDLEFTIQNMLIDFSNEHGCKIEHVGVDTRNFANLNVEIHLAEDKGKP